MGLWWSEVQILSPRPRSRQEATLQRCFLPCFILSTEKRYQTILELRAKLRAKAVLPRFLFSSSPSPNTSFHVSTISFCIDHLTPLHDRRRPFSATVGHFQPARTHQHLTP